MAEFSVRLDLKPFEAQLKKLAKPNALLARAINRSLASGKTAVARAIADDTRLPVSTVKRHVRVEQATVSRLEGRVFASAKRIPLIEFKARGPVPSRGKGSGVRASLAGGVGRYPRAFITTVGKGHTGVFERKTTKRLPIHELFGPSLWQAFTKHKAIVRARTQEQLIKNVRHEIQYALQSGATR